MYTAQKKRFISAKLRSPKALFKYKMAANQSHSTLHKLGLGSQAMNKVLFCIKVSITIKREAFNAIAPINQV